MKTLLILAAAAAIAPAFVACSNNPQQEAVKQDEQVMEQLGDKGDADVAEPGTAGVTADGDTVVTILDAVDIK